MLYQSRLKPEDLKDNTVITTRYVKFQNVQNITVTNTRERELLYQGGLNLI